jgi:DNA repair photolyase
MEEMRRYLPIIRGRGAGDDPPNRFDRLHVELDEDAGVEHAERDTQYFKDPSRSVLTRNDSPDVPFEWSLNPYRGCEHGCSYCYARPTHEYLGYSAGLDFETRILAKEDAPALLRAALTKPSWKPTALAMSGVTDPYQPIERRLRITRRCLEVLDETRHPVTVITKSSAIERDVDLLASLARSNLVHATLSVTTLDRALQRAMEPRASPPKHRIGAIHTLADAGIPVSVAVAPVIPGLTEHEIPSILEAAAAAGARGASMILLRLPGAVEGIFLDWLEEHLPERFDRVVARLREVRGGRLSDPRFGSRMTGEGLYAEQIRRLFRVSARKMGLDRGAEPLSLDAFRRSEPHGRGERGSHGRAEDTQLDFLA